MRAGATQGGYVGFELNENGTRVRYRKRDGAYQTDILAERAADFITRASQQHNPFFYLAPRAPHGPATPAARHVGMFDDEPMPRTSSFTWPGRPANRPGCRTTRRSPNRRSPRSRPPIVPASTRCRRWMSWSQVW